MQLLCGAYIFSDPQGRGNEPDQSALALEGIADTPEADKLIDVVIPLLVLALPKTHTTAAKSEAVAPNTNGAA